MTGDKLRRLGVIFPKSTGKIRAQFPLVVIRYMQMIWLSQLAVMAQAQNTSSSDCFTESDQFVGNAQSHFRIGAWIERGNCIKRFYNNDRCYPTLLGVLQHLNQLRAAEYNGAAGVLALLPTIGALLGAPTSEIWKLLTIVPFGGVLAMALSFGGAILPIKVEDYEPADNPDLPSVSSFRVRKRRELMEQDQKYEREQRSPNPNIEALADRLLEKLRNKLHKTESVRMPKVDLWLGILGMVLLLIGAQAAMTVVELGAILPWWCSSPFWMHMWYFMVTITAIAENWVQLPFSKQFKLYLSNVPYNINVTGGQDITKKLKAPGSLEDGTMAGEEASEAIGTALKQLQTVQAGVIRINGGVIQTKPRNSVLVMVSVIENGFNGSRLSSFLRLISKSTSIAVFVTGTAFFASAQLLALPMAVMALTLLLAAAVFSRAIASYITTAADRSEPMIHVMVDKLSEAHQVIAKIMTLTPREEDLEELQSQAIQVEVNGHIFVNCKRVATRSRLHTSLLGIMAEPFDLASLVRRTQEPAAPGYSSLLSQQNSTTSNSIGAVE